MKNKKVLLLSAEPARTFDRQFLHGVAKYGSLETRWNLHGDILDTSSQLAPTFESFDGVIIGAPTSEQVEILQAKGIPTLTYRIQSPVPNPLSVQVLTDNAAIGALAAEYFSKRGYRHFAYLGSPVAEWNPPRRNGFTDALKGEDVFQFEHFPFNPENDSDWRTITSRVTQWLVDLPKPIALFAGSDVWGRFTLNLCSEANLSVPYDISILGEGDDALICDFCYKPLSSIRLNVARAGFHAAKGLDALIDKAPPQESIIPVSPILVEERQSTGCFAIDDKNIARALELIRDSRRKVIRVEEILAKIPMSRRSLEQRFKEYTGDTLAGSIRRTRAEYACRLLLETDMTIYQIADQLGYDDQKHFARFFKSVMGCPPTTYRFQSSRA